MDYTKKHRKELSQKIREAFQHNQKKSAENLMDEYQNLEYDKIDDIYRKYPESKKFDEGFKKAKDKLKFIEDYKKTHDYMNDQLRQDALKEVLKRLL